MAVKEPMSANDYDDRTTAAVKSVLLEIGQILGSFQGKFAVVGGAVPWLLLNESEMPHIGTIDVDLALDPVALADGEYATLAESLIKHGYHQRSGLRKFQLARTLNMRPTFNLEVQRSVKQRFRQNRRRFARLRWVF